LSLFGAMEGWFAFMNEDILNRSNARLDRRSFLRGSTLATAAIVGTRLVPLAAFPQTQAGDQTNGDARRGDPKDQQKPPDDGSEGKEEPKQNGNPTEDPYKVIRLDEQGREYRLYPVCGSNILQAGSHLDV
jgi:hypothetical protein